MLRTDDRPGHNLTCNTSCPNPVDGAWSPTLLGLWAETSAAAPEKTCRVVIQLGFNETLHLKYGAPSTVFVEYLVEPRARRVQATLTWHNKTTTRLPEAMTLFVTPQQRPGYRWELDSLGEWLSPANVTVGGEQYQHAVWSGVRYTTSDPASVRAPGLWITTQDAAMACPVLNSAGKVAVNTTRVKNCFMVDDGARRQKNGADSSLNDTMIDGMGINLHNNKMGISGFAQWYPFGVGRLYQGQDESAKFRFVLEER